MKKSDIEMIVDLFESHLHTIDLAIYLVGVVLAILSFVTWKAVKSTINNKVESEIHLLVEKEREKIKKFIEDKIKKIAIEEGNEAYRDIEKRIGSKDEEI